MTTTWHCEIRWLGSSNRNRSGDCILLRWGDDLEDPNKRVIAVIDAGRNDDDYSRLVDELRGLDVNVIDYLIGTHSDTDHISQFRKLLDDRTIGVGRLWLMNPYDYIDEAYGDGDCVALTASAGTVANTVFHPMVTTGEVEHLNPTAGTATHDGCLEVVGPSLAYYLELLPEIFSRSELEDARQNATSDLAAFAVLAAHERANFTKQAALTAAAGAAAPSWNDDELGSGLGDPTNNASLILLFTCPDGTQYLFTGDAGVPAFDSAANAMDLAGFDASQLRIFQLPHHGSAGNVSAELLNRLLGEPIEDREVADEAVSEKLRRCIAMCGEDDPHHASGRVTDAVYRRGWTPYATNSSTIISHRWSPPGAEPRSPGTLTVIGFGQNPKDRPH